MFTIILNFLILTPFYYFSIAINFHIISRQDINPFVTARNITVITRVFFRTALIIA